MLIPPALQQRYRRLFGFYDRNGDGRLTLADDHGPAAVVVAERWQGRRTPFPDLLTQLMATYRHEGERRDLDGNGAVDEEEFVASHSAVIAAFGRLPEQARAFIAKSAGGFFDCLDLDRDGVLDLADLQAYAAAYGKPTAGIQANLARMLAAFDLPPDRLPRAVFLELVTQYWFDPSADAPGRWLFDLDPSSPTSELC
jgi:Ca2+-binding EF-hand superfamily protein